MQKHWEAPLLEVILLLVLHKEVQSCRIIVESTVIHLGHSLLASCSSRCPQFGSGAVVWKLDNDFVPQTLYRKVLENTSSIYFNSFNKTSGLLQCYIKTNEGLQLVDEIHIRAGYPPFPPTDLSCLMNITKNILTCTWQPGKDSLLATNVTLSSSRSVEQCKMPLKSDFNCNPVWGQSSCNIPRQYFHSTKKLAIWVTEVNELGSTSSTPICLIPLLEVKLDPVTFTSSHSSGDCVKLLWTYGKAGFLKSLKCELRYKSEYQIEWSTPIEIPLGSKETNQCGLLSGTTYNFQIRCIRKNLTGQWSDWGPPRSQTTEDSVPTGKINTWWKIIKGAPDSPEKIQLFWKPLKKEEANSKSIWYIVKTSSDQYQRDTLLCNTTALNCTFSLLPGMKQAFIWACNMAGASPIQRVIFSINGAPVHRVHASPINDSSLQVEWEPITSAKSYVIEWCKSTQLSNCEINWKIEPGGCNTSILHDNIEPLKMYTVTLYPVYENTVGLPEQTEAYSKEAAPDFSPKLSLSAVSKSQAEIYWEPISLEKRNGFITNYTIFWTDMHGRTYFSTVDRSSTKFLMNNLLPSTTYQVFIRSSTAGGSTNGSAMMLHTAVLDNTDITLIFLFFTLLFFLMMISVSVICIIKHERMKNRFWPTVPDPAKSLLGKWTSFLEEVPKMIINPTDVSQILTSEVTIVEDWQGKNPPESSTKDTRVSGYNSDSQNYIYTSSHQTSSATDNTNKWEPYINTDTVQYAQIISEDYQQQSPSPSTYIRSDSTQPLLCNRSPSLQNYENMWFHCNHQEDNVFLTEEVEPFTNFPMLQALQMHEEGEMVQLFN